MNFHLRGGTLKGIAFGAVAFLLGMPPVVSQAQDKTRLKSIPRINLGTLLDVKHPEWRGLLASPGLQGQAVKGTYFFPGEAGDNVNYTTHPKDPRDSHWNSDPSTRGWVMDRMVQDHLNTVVMSYWSNMPQWSPMVLDSTSVPGVISAVGGRPLVIMPAIESGFDDKHPEIPHWEFKGEFPNGVSGLVERIGSLVTLFKGNMPRWAKIYDRNGQARYAVNILHVSSNLISQVPGRADDEAFARSFDVAADEVYRRYKIRVGFTLDTIGMQRYSPSPSEAGAAFERTASVLAIQGFASEVFSGLVNSSRPNQTAIDNNKNNNIQRMADWKKAAVGDWIKTGVPVILDVSNGFDGRKVWAGVGAGFWGDNLSYTDDRWRNWMSQVKRPGIKGITFNTWNGYTEGYAATSSIEHGDTVYNWLRDLMEPPPWDYTNVFYANGRPTYKVYGAICDKWLQLGADRAFGPPTSSELAAGTGRVQYFADGKAIYWSGNTGAHELHGLILKAYQNAGAFNSRLGFPTSDEEGLGDGRVNRFEHGRIEWKPGDTLGRIIY
ncbi:hypothetical protein EON83_15385 [bacterium]|nr:MAG: hypothetical protein EON83_15385 [bacterium]